MTARGDPEPSHCSLQAGRERASALWGKLSPEGLSCFPGPRGLASKWQRTRKKARSFQGVANGERVRVAGWFSQCRLSEGVSIVGP